MELKINNAIAEAERQRDRLNMLYKKYGLIKEDTFVMQGDGKNIPIITRTGIEKIQAIENIELNYELCFFDGSTAVVKCNGKKGELILQTFGECSPKNSSQTYPVAMAEKRAKARCILQMAGFYKLGVYSEVEAEEFTEENK